MESRLSLRNVTIILAALWLPLSMLIGNLVTAFYKSTNPNDVDITAGLAYLRQSLFAGFGAAGLIAVIIIGLVVLMYRRSGNFKEAKLPLAVFAIVGVVTLSALVVNGYINAVEDQYRRDHPTVKE